MKRLTFISSILLSYLFIPLVVILSVYFFRVTNGASLFGCFLLLPLTFLIKWYKNIVLNRYKQTIYEKNGLTNVNKQLSAYFSNSIRNNYFQLDREDGTYKITDKEQTVIINDKNKVSQLSTFKTIYQRNRHEVLKDAGSLFEYQHLLKGVNVYIKRLEGEYKPRWVYVEEDKTIECENYIIDNTVIYSVGASTQSYDTDKMKALLYSFEKIYTSYKSENPLLSFEVRIVRGLLYVVLPTNSVVAYNKLYLLDFYTHKGEYTIMSQYFKAKNLHDTLYKLLEKESLDALFSKL